LKEVDRLLWVIFVGLDAHEECPLFLRSLPNRCVAATDEKGHQQTHALQNHWRGANITRLAIPDKTIHTVMGCTL
jgi:hypothetical protein